MRTKILSFWQFIVFDIVVPTTMGCLYCLEFMRHTQEATHDGIKLPDSMVTLEVLHARLGHMNVAAAKHVATALGLDLISKSMNIYKACARAKMDKRGLSR